MPSARIGEPKRETRRAIDRIGADRGDQDADAHADQGVGQRALADRDDAQQAEHHDDEILRRGEPQRELRQRLGQRHHDDGRKKPAAERRNQGPAERLGRPALAAHGVAVPQHRHVDRLARNAEQDGGERAAIGAGDVHRRQQHDRGGDVHLVGERQRQGDAHHQGEAGQHADQQADHDADEQHRHVHGRQAMNEAPAKLPDDVEHGWFPSAADHDADQIGEAVERRLAAGQRDIGEAQEHQSNDEGRDHGDAPDRDMIAVAAEIHEGGHEQKRAEQEAEHRQQHGVGDDQRDAAEHEIGMGRLLLFVRRLREDRRGPGRSAAPRKRTHDLDDAQQRHQADGELRPEIRPERVAAWGVFDPACRIVQRRPRPRRRRGRAAPAETVSDSWGEDCSG